MATVQRTDFNLNNQKRFSEGAVATFPAKLDDGNPRLGTGPSYIDPADSYQAFCLPKSSIVREVYIYTREAFAPGTLATVKTIVDGEVIETDLDVSAINFTYGYAFKPGNSLEWGMLLEKVDGFEVSFNQTSTVGVLQVVCNYTSIDETSGKYVASV